MVEDFSFQYNKINKKFKMQIQQDLQSRKHFYEVLEKFKLNRKKILDAGCGEGVDLNHYQKFKGKLHACDASEEFIKEVKEQFQDIKSQVCIFENLPYKNEYFDVILSKYAIQTCANLELVFNEFHRVLKKKGIMIYLSVHPIRQFIEKKEKFKNYFEQTKIQSVLFHGEVIVNEHSHTIQEYFNENILDKFEIVDFQEGADFNDTSAQQVGGNYYPSYFICVMRKK